MVAKLESIGAQELMEEVIEPPVWLVEGLLPTSSTNLLCSPPEIRQVHPLSAARALDRNWANLPQSQDGTGRSPVPLP